MREWSTGYHWVSLQLPRRRVTSYSIRAFIFKSLHWWIDQFYHIMFDKLPPDRGSQGIPEEVVVFD